MYTMTSADLKVDGALERCKNFSQGNDTTSQAMKGNVNDTDFGAVMYIIAVLTFYSLGIVVMIVKYLKTERKEMEEEMVLESFFKGIPDKRIEHEIESVNRVAIHAFHTLTASRAMPCDGSIPTSMESSYTEHNPGARDSLDHGQGMASHFSRHTDADGNQATSSLTDMYLTVDQASYLRHSGQRRQRRRFPKGAEGGERNVSRDSDDFVDPLPEDARGVGFVSPVSDIEDHVGDNYETLSQMRAKDRYRTTGDIEQPQISSIRNSVCEDGKKKKTTSFTEIDDGGMQFPARRVSETDKGHSKRNKTVIFSDAIKPTPKDLEPIVSDGSNKLCPTPSHTRRFSDLSEIRSPSTDLPPNRSVAPKGVSLSRSSSTAGDYTAKRIPKGPTKYQRRFQLEPVRWHDIKQNGRTGDSSADVTSGASHGLPVSSSCNAISDLLRHNVGWESREAIEKTPSEREQGAFENETSRLNQSSKHIYPYNSTASRPLPTRVRIIDPHNNGDDGKTILVTDL